MRQHRAQGPPSTSRAHTAAVAPRAALPKKVSGRPMTGSMSLRRQLFETAPLALVIAAGITKTATSLGDSVVRAALAIGTTGRASAATVPAIS